MDQSKKTMRHFYCRDVLWETFEQMANDFDCSIDYLINEAMRFYARSKNYNAGVAPPSSPSVPQPANGPIGGYAATRSSSQTRPPLPPPAPAPVARANLPTPAPRTPRTTPAPPNPRISSEASNGAGPVVYLVFNNQ